MYIGGWEGGIRSEAAGQAEAQGRLGGEAEGRANVVAVLPRNTSTVITNII